MTREGGTEAAPAATGRRFRCRSAPAERPSSGAYKLLSKVRSPASGRGGKTVAALQGWAKKRSLWDIFLLTRDVFWTKLARVEKWGAGEAGALPARGGTPPVISTGAPSGAERRNLPPMGTRFLRSLRSVEMTRGGGTDPAPAATGRRFRCRSASADRLSSNVYKPLSKDATPPRRRFKPKRTGPSARCGAGDREIFPRSRWAKLPHAIRGRAGSPPFRAARTPRLDAARSASIAPR